MNCNLNSVSGFFCPIIESISRIIPCSVDWSSDGKVGGVRTSVYSMYFEGSFLYDIIVRFMKPVFRFAMKSVFRFVSTKDFYIANKRG